MTALLKFLMPVYRYPTQTGRLRAYLVYGFLLLGIILFSAYAFLVPDWNYPPELGLTGQISLVQVMSYRAEAILYVLGPYVLMASGYLAVRWGKLAIASWIATILGFILSIVPGIVFSSVNYSNPQAIVGLPIFIFISALLVGARGALISTAIVLLALFLDQGPMPLGQVLTIAIELLVAAAIAYLFVRFNSISREEGRDRESAERLKLAEITTRITRLASQRATLQEVMESALALIVENYPLFYHVQVFLIDESRVQARLAASTGLVGKRLLERAHGLAVGSLSVIGQTTFRGNSVLAYAGAPDTIHRPNELLPNTLTEVAFPLRTENQIIGALDLQSIEYIELSEDEQTTFQALADSLALAIDSTRQFEAARLRVEENQRLVEQARSALAEVQRLNKRLIGRAWAEYLRESSDTSIEIDLQSSEVKPLAANTSAIEQAISSNQVVRQPGTLALPLLIRGEVVGALELEIDDDSVGNVTYDLIEEVQQRFSLAAENTRLLEESQRLAQREALVNEIGSRLQSTNNVEATLAEAARSLRETLGAQRVAIRLGAPPGPSSRVGGRANE